MQKHWTGLLICLLLANVNVLHAGEYRTHHCATSEDVHKALEIVEPGDTIVLQGGTVYEIDESLELRAHGTNDARITLTSEDSSGQDRYAVITTVGQRKEENLVAVSLTGSFWNVSRLEIAGKKVPLAEGFWDTNGFRIGLYLQGRNSHHNVIEDIHHIFNKKTAEPVRVDYLGEIAIPAPTGRDNTVASNILYTNDSRVQIVQNDLAEADRASFTLEKNRVESLDAYLETE